MKKKYEKPMLVCEDLRPEEMLCICDYTNPQFSELELCSFTLKFTEFTTFVIFGESWINCDDPNTLFQGTQYYYCYRGPEVSLFSS